MDMGRNSKFKDGIRIAAAIYLIYLAVEIAQDGLIGGQMQGKMRIVGVIAVIGFIAFGVVVTIWSVKDLIKLGGEEKADEESDSLPASADDPAADGDHAAGDPAEDEDAGDGAAPKSLYERAMRNTGSEEDDS